MRCILSSDVEHGEFPGETASMGLKRSAYKDAIVRSQKDIN